MARARYFNNAFTYSGVAVEIVPFAVVTLYDNLSSTEAIADTIYAGPTGGTTKSNPFLAAANGDIEFWLDTPRELRVKITGPGLGELNMDYQPVWPNPTDIVLDDENSKYFVNIMDYADGNDISYTTLAAALADTNTKVNHTNAAIVAAIQAAVDTGKILYLPPGAYKGKFIYQDNVHIMGAGKGKTFIVRPDGPASAAYNPAIDYSTLTMFEKVNTRLTHLTVDGNYSKNNNDLNGTSLDELTTGSSAGAGFPARDQYISDVTFQNFNYGASSLGGLRTTFNNIEIYGVTPLPTVYKAEFTDGTFLTRASRNYASYWGIHCSNYDYIKDLRMSNCYARDIRINPFILGGLNIKLENIQQDNCHRGKSYTTADYTVGSTSADGVAGGQSAFVPTHNGVAHSLQPSQNVVANGLISGYTEGIYASGWEFDSVLDMTVTNFIANYCPRGALTVANAKNLSVTGFISSASGTAADGVGLLIYDSENVVFNGPIVSGPCTTGIYIYNGPTGGQVVENVTINNPIMDGCTTNFITTPNSGGVRIVNPMVADGTSGVADDFVISNPALFAKTIRNSHATGNGLSVQGGSTTSQFAFFVGDYVGTALFYVTAGTTNLTIFNTSNTGATVRPMAGFAESNVAKGYFGLNASDNFCIIAGDGATELFSVSSNSTPVGQLNSPSLEWTTFTPNLYQGGASPLGVTSRCKWLRIGKLLFYRLELAITDNTNAVANQPIFISHQLPASNRPSIVGGGSHGGDGLVYRVGTEWLHVGVILTDSQSMYLMENRGQNYAGAWTTAFRLLNNDVISLHGFFEVA